MKLFRRILFFTFMVFIMATFSQCGVTKLETKVPVTLGEVYYQDWVAGVDGGGSGITVVIPVISNPKNIVLDSVHFRGRQTSLEYRNNAVYIGRFKADSSQKKDIIMSSDPYAEYGNKAPKIAKKSSFELNEDQCIVSYKIGNKVKYFKIDKIIKKDNKLFMETQLKKP